MNTIWEQALLEPIELLGQQVLAILPNLLAMSILLLLGLATAWACSHFFERVLRAVGLDRLCDRLGIVAALLRGGIKVDPSHLVGRTVYWIIVIFASMASLGALNVAPINQAAHSFWHTSLA
jgi:hypothetical protein